MATTYTDATAGRVTAWPLQGRTDDTGAEVTGEHFDGKDAATVLGAYTEGVLSADAFEVNADSPAAMTVVVGSGTVGDRAYLEGSENLQGVYSVAWPDATSDVSIDAADASNPRIDEIYLVIQHDQFDSSGFALPRLAYRDGTPASSPSAPGPDASWTAYLLLASIDVEAAATEIEAADITDERVQTGPSPSVMGAWEVDGSDEVTSEELLGAGTQSVASVTLTIPSDWNEWKCYAAATWVGFSTSAGSGDYQAWIRIDGTNIQPAGVSRRVEGTGEGGISASANGYRTGITTTGDRTVDLRAFDDSADDVFVGDVVLYARAVRTA